MLKYHVVPGVAARASDLRNEQRLATLQGANLAVRTTATPGSAVQIVGVGSRANVVTADVSACKAVVHVVDTVLLPVSPGGH